MDTADLSRATGPMPDVAAPRPAGPVALAVGLGAVYLLWGSTYLGNRVALESLPPMLCTSARFLAAALLLFAVALLRRGPVGLLLPRREWRGVGASGLLMVGAGSALLTLGQQYVPTALTSLLVAGMPLWVLVIRLVAGPRPSSRAALGVLGGVLGLVLLFAAPAGRWHLGGMLLVVLSTMVWALGSTLAQRLSMPADHLVGTGWQMLVGGLAVAVASVVSGELGRFHPAEVTGRSWLAWTYLMLVCTVVGFSVYTWLLRNAPLQLASTYAYVNPVVAVLLGMMVLDERLTGRQALAGLVVLASVALVIVVERPRQVEGLPAGTPVAPT
ncbi:EamA family transporter [Micromonospora echinofusca]|uniref:EamA family transporter n=1 Tax=Micromonospora echinofusca TaxID=47858 RepID=A0ABS3VMB5_MICEH|nr:EamA family transporter [Micromonospora echinofusca]MBO4205670.1 EamA family transporter [Micromonospora echinofusca]